MVTTNYRNTLIQLADDSPTAVATEPPARGASPTVARLQWELLAERPYAYTSDDLLFEVHAIRNAIPDAEREAARAAFFSRSQACLRASPLPKKFGWGLHHDAEERVALVPADSEDYRRLSDDPEVTTRKAMRSRRA